MQGDSVVNCFSQHFKLDSDVFGTKSFDSSTVCMYGESVADDHCQHIEMYSNVKKNILIIK